MSDPQSAFDPNLFLDSQVTEVNEKRPTFPADNPASPDGLYMAVIGEIKAEAGTIGKGDRTGQPWLSMVIPLKLEFPPQVQALGLPPQFQLTDRAFIDLTAQNTIDNSKGKNRQQRAYRDATNLNNPGDSFNWRSIQGRTVKVKVAHELYEGNIVEKVAGVFKS